jgi:hypothetical protein
MGQKCRDYESVMSEVYSDLYKNKKYLYDLAAKENKISSNSIPEWISTKVL